MPRARWNKNGFVIAKAGFDVDTAATGDILFSYIGATERVYLSGSVGFGGNVNTGPYTTHYQASVVTFGKTFPKPPKAIVCVLDSTYAMAFVGVQAAVGSGLVGGVFYGWYEPDVCYVTTTTNLTLYTRYANTARLNTFLYAILENTTQ